MKSHHWLKPTLLTLFSIILLNYAKISEANMTQDNVYKFMFLPINGKDALPLSNFKGKVILIVNTASKCGFTKQYKGLEELHHKYKAQGLVVLGVPSNDFRGQEPGSNEEIANFCHLNYGVTFPMTAKEKVTGKKAHPFYLWAKEKLGLLSAPKWNFHKYLINRKGALVNYYFSTITPDDPKLVQQIEELLQESE